MQVQPYNPQKKVQNLNIIISCYLGQLTIPNTSLYYSLDQCKCQFNNTTLHISYQNIISFGKNQLDLIMFIKSERQEQDQDQEDKDYSLYQLLVNKLNDETEQNYNLVGPYIIRVDFTSQGKDNLQFTFQELSQRATDYDENNGEEGEDNQNQNEDQNEEDEEFQFDLDQMITAKDIDEDGNILKPF